MLKSVCNDGVVNTTMKMNQRMLRRHIIIVISTMTSFFVIESIPVGAKIGEELKLEPAEAIVYAGDNITFTCSYPSNVTFDWDFNDAIHPYKIFKGVSRDANGELFWSQLSISSVKRMMSGEITCSILETADMTEAFLIVNGVQIGGICKNENDCITDKATCRDEICSCPRDEILLKLTENGYEVCRKMIYRLYDPCEFTEQCFHLVDSKSVCSTNGVCICAPWTMDIHGKCVTKSEMAYSKNQELYRVGLVAITCLIIVIVAVSLWITLRKSCQNENIEAQLRSITQRDDQASEEVNMETIEDKPPSYDDLLESADTMSDPPNIKEALTHSTTAKKFLRQSSAPAGQLLCTAIINTQPSGRLGAQTVKKKGS